MMITDIQKTKKGRFSIFLDGEFAFSLHADVLVASPVRIGYEADADELERYRTESEEKITKERALRLLSARNYTAKGLYDKLKQYADGDGAVAAVERMSELGLVNDGDYARKYAADCINFKGYSISRETAEAVLSELDSDPEQAIAGIITRKYMRYLDSENEKGIVKVMNAMLRLGYRHGDIRRVISNLLSDANYYNYTDIL